MFNKKGKIITGIMVLSLMFGTYAFSEGACGGAEMHGKMFKKMFKGLDLTDGQKGQMKQHFKESKEAGKEIREQLKAAKDLFRDELGKPEPSSKAIDAIVVRMKDNSVKAIDHRVNSMIQIREILTEEQYSEFLKKTEKHRFRKKASRNRKIGIKVLNNYAF